MKEFWNERYAEPEFAYGVLPNDFFKNQLDKLNPGSILLICEGEGRNAVYAAKNGWKVDAFDSSEQAMKKALQLADENNVTINYQAQDALEIDYPENSFDVIAAIYAHFPDSIRTTIHRKMQRWLKPNGLIILEAFNLDQIVNTSGGPKDISMLYAMDRLKTDFNELLILQNQNEEIQLNEGKFHSGKANVLRFLAKK